MTPQDWQFAAELARMPQAPERLLALHTIDAAGRCVGCRSQVRPPTRWPCVLYAAAAQARRIATGGTVDESRAAPPERG